MFINTPLIGAASALALLAACATAPTTAPATAQNPSCVSQSPGRSANPADCSPGGRSYTNDEIRRTGATTVGDALAQLDPSITVHH